MSLLGCLLESRLEYLSASQLVSSLVSACITKVEHNDDKERCNNEGGKDIACGHECNCKNNNAANHA